MKWNFECKSEQRDYLHGHRVARCNGFAMSGETLIIIGAALTCSNKQQTFVQDR
jgi:hypothetical protein